jgi:hypothetical protein
VEEDARGLRAKPVRRPLALGRRGGWDPLGPRHVKATDNRECLPNPALVRVDARAPKNPVEVTVREPSSQAAAAHS